MEVIEVIKGFGLELTEEQESQIKKAVGKEYVLRSDFNSKNNELKNANTKIKELESRDFSSLEADRDDYKTKYEDLLKEKNDNEKKDKFFSKVEDCKDKDYLLYKIGGVDALELDDKGEIKDVDNILKSAREEYPSCFGKTAPFVVSKTDGPNQNVANQKEQANTAFRSLFGKE